MNIVVRLVALGLLLAGIVSSAGAASLVTGCGASVRNTTRTSTDTFSFSAQTFTPVPNTAFSVPIATGQQRCVTVTFSASANCPLGCFMRVLDNSTALEPAFDVEIANGNSNEVHSFQWVRRLTVVGGHTIKVVIRTGSNAQSAIIGPYTTTLDVAE